MAEQSLEGKHEVLPREFENEERLNPANAQGNHTGRMVLCVDAGGTSCRAALMSADGEIASSIGGPCNVTTTGLDIALATVTRVVQEALGKHPATRGQALRTVAFSQVWVGMAGYDRLSLRPSINDAFSDLFRLPLSKGLRMSTDIDLLPAALSSRQDITSVIVLVVGTGSIAMSYRRDGNEYQRIGRVGGWGKLLGDDGSGYATGREGIRKTLRYCDLHTLKRSIGAAPLPFPPLPKAIMKHFQGLYPDCIPENLLSTLLVPAAVLGGQEDAEVTRTRNIAGAASIVLSMATEDAEAQQIVESGAASVAELVGILVREQCIDTAHCALILGGGLMGNSIYKREVLVRVQEQCGAFAHIEAVGQPVIAGAKHLLDCDEKTI